MPEPKKRAQKPSPKTDRAAQESGSNTFSTRLTDKQKEWVEKAAEIKNWTPANLIRVAAIEKAAHILNISTRTRFNFRGLASKIAKQLVSPETWMTDHEDQRVEIGHPAFEGDLYPESSCLYHGDVQKFKEAVEIGGLEFLGLILEACEDLTVEQRSDLPDPIKPE